LKRLILSAFAPVGSVVAVRTTERQIVLTFDDGPDPVGTEQVLSALAACRSKATFFVLITRTRRYPTLLREVSAEGHEIGLHGLDHRPLTAFTYREAEARTLAAKSELEQTLDLPVRWYRPPYGRQTPATWFAVRQCGLEPVMWGPTLWDWRDIDQGARLEKARLGAAPGAIVLGHDSFAGPSDGAEPALEPVVDRYDLVRHVVSDYANLGLAATSLEQALKGGTPVRLASFHG
jgi:peptidoglycan/xylan/chitin deacetylase (PgdA/CDA1 family)